MPILSAYFGVSVTDILYENKDNSLKFITFPYSYSKAAFGNQCSEAEFNRAILSKMIGVKKKSLSSYDLLVSGLLKRPQISSETKLSKSIIEVLPKITDYTPIFLTGFGLFTNKVMGSSFSCNLAENEADDFDEDEELDYLANLCIFPQITPADLTKRSILDSDISKWIPPNGFDLDPKIPVVFTGDRFSQPTLHRELDYLVMLDIFKQPGIYDLYVDTKNALLLTQLVKEYDPNKNIDLDKYIQYLGVLVTTNSDIECLIKSDVETKQFFEVKENDVFVSPISEEVNTTISIKNNTLGNLEFKVRGGRLGCIFDTRIDKNSSVKNIRFVNESIRQFGENLSNI